VSGPTGAEAVTNASGTRAATGPPCLAGDRGHRRSGSPPSTQLG